MGEIGGLVGGEGDVEGLDESATLVTRLMGLIELGVLAVVMIVGVAEVVVTVGDTIVALLGRTKTGTWRVGASAIEAVGLIVEVPGVVEVGAALEREGGKLGLASLVVLAIPAAVALTSLALLPPTLTELTPLAVDPLLTLACCCATCWMSCLCT